MIPLPPGWTEKENYDIETCHGRTGYYVGSTKTIYLCSPRLSWLPGWLGRIARASVLRLTRKHERGHAHGIKGCKRPWCIMFEAFTWKATWKDCRWERWLMAVCGLFTFFHFCKECRKHLRRVETYANE